MIKKIRRRTIKESVNNSEYLKYILEYFNYNLPEKLEDIFEDLVYRAMMEECEDTYDCIMQAVDEGLIYTNDQWEVYRFYCDMGDPVEQMYDGLISDISEIIDNIKNSDMDEGYRKYIKKKLKESFNKFYVDFGTGAGNFEAKTLNSAKRYADKEAAYTQKDIVIYDDNGEVTRRHWWGVKYDPEQDDSENPINFNDYGYYDDWD